MLRVVTDPEEVKRRLAAYRCLGCNQDGMNHPSNLDKSTGFPAQLCDTCRAIFEAERPRKTPSVSRYNREHRAEGLANIDRWLVDDEPTAKPVR